MTDEERATVHRLMAQMAEAYQSGISIVARMANDMSAKMQSGQLPRMDGPTALLALATMAEKMVDNLRDAPHPPLPGDPP